MSGKNILNKSESTLIAKKIFIEKMSFQRNNCSKDIIRMTESRIGKEIEDLGDDRYKCSIMLELNDEDKEAELEIIVSGLFEFETQMDQNMKNVIVTKNTMAILFPYLRTQVTLMTAQPDIQTVVLPPININSLLTHIEETES